MSTLHLQSIQILTPPDELADFYRLEISRANNSSRQGELGQYLTPLPVARFMASLFDEIAHDVILLDPGAGTGVLTAAFLQEMVHRRDVPQHIRAICYELDSLMADYLDSTLQACKTFGDVNKLHFDGTVFRTDFIQWSVEKLQLKGSFFEESLPRFTHCILNPPYKRIHGNSEHRARLKKIGIETTNLYSAFLALAIHLLAPGGELVAIVPRSFCNGPYFREFRQLLLANMSIRQLHTFESRDQLFAKDNVLQENIIIHAVKEIQNEKVLITSSSGIDFEGMTQREVPFVQVVKPKDSDAVIHIAVSEVDQMVVDRISVFQHTLNDIGINVSTGPVIDFRLQEDIRKDTESGTYPLIYPNHFKHGFVQWPNSQGRKPNAIVESDNSRRWLMKNGWYVLTRRFSSKEERRRIIAVLHNPQRVPGKKIGFENHINIFHAHKEGLDPTIAKGLAIYLNSTLIDLYFRQFSGHTQVNATDLRALHYPSLKILRRLGGYVLETFPDQDQIDHLLDEVINEMTSTKTRNPLPIHRRVQEALTILNILGLPKAQRNERSALTLLALVGLEPEYDWRNAKAPLIGITPIIEFIYNHYGKRYAPNTRETIRRQTMHQFIEAGIAISNPDDPARPINSPKWCYQIAPATLSLLRTFGTDSWDDALKNYLQQQPALVEKYEQRRLLKMIPLELPGKQNLLLTPGKHSELIKSIIEEFGPRFASGAKVLYVGDTGEKMLLFDKDTFAKLGLTFDSHGKFPDVVLYQPQKKWLFLIEAVTSHGPVNAKRHAELAALFSPARADIVYVTAFPDRHLLARYLTEISWETEVWVAASPGHLIHFDGDHFLGPYTNH